ncbi:EFM4 [Malassezia furfur]|nr:EFM4 [Malassezia furfur]
MIDPGAVEELPESQLGTKEHWDRVYAVERMIAYLVELLEDNPFQHAPYVLDLGTGNGHLLFSLLEAQEELPSDALDPRRLCGVDYSSASIDLARAIAEKRGDGCESIVFDEADLRDHERVARLKQDANAGEGWDIVCDKGTIALSSQPVHGKLPVDLYVEAVVQLTRREPSERPGIFFITSCNFTQDELERKFVPAGFAVEHVVPAPTFMFNASRAKLKSVPIANTKANLWITSILLQHGFIYNVTRGTIAGPSAVDWNSAPDVRRRLWVDLKYRSDDRPVLERMNLVSKPSRRLSMTSEELLRWVTGRRAKFVTPLRAGEIGIIDCGKDGWFEAKEAMRRKLTGEVVCRVS